MYNIVLLYNVIAAATASPGVWCLLEPSQYCWCGSYRKKELLVVNAPLSLRLKGRSVIREGCIGAAVKRHECNIENTSVPASKASISTWAQQTICPNIQLPSFNKIVAHVQ